MPNHLRSLRRRIALAVALAVVACVAACLTVLWTVSSTADLASARRVLEDISNAPLATSDVDGDAAPYIMVGLPAWARAHVAADGSVEVVDVSNGSISLDSDDLAALVDLREEWRSEPFSWNGRVWIALWQPVGTQKGALIVSADGGDAATVPDEGISEARIYSFLDVSACVASARTLGIGCAAACAAVFVLTLVVGWVAAGHALRPVAEAEERERTFVCAASHDLVTPLMAVTANCDVLEAETPDRADLAPWIANIRAASDEMAARIAEMLSRL